MEKEKSWRPDNWENPYKCETIMGVYPEQAEYAAREAFEAGADAMYKADVEWLEKNVFYIDTRGFIALKPRATENWLTFIGRSGEESETEK